MTTFLKVFRLALIFVLCVFAGSCAKDTDLISGYLINTPTHKKDVSMIFDQETTVQVPEVDVKIHVFNTDDDPKWDKIGIKEKALQHDKIAVLEFE
ncbi:hypothetical protein [Maribacter sp. LLG6340-A2]|uniref:hypothetical protein n=1 Tax=Maribacter sp. LLG6340-A2 TaxID=3160834 RepID=UPI00386E953D